MWAWIAGVEENMDEELPRGSAGRGKIATGSVSSCSPLWWSFVRKFVVMHRIEIGCRLMWTIEALQRKEMQIFSSASEHHEFVSNAVDEMVVEKAVTRLPPRERP
jgi:hypothetical protein